MNGALAREVLSAPAVTLMIAQITNLLEVPHVDFQSVLMDHDPLYQRSGGTFRDRIARTVTRPLPIVFGDIDSRQRCATRLIRYHRPMTGTNPDDGSAYSATSPESMLFAAVTISHAGLIAYERFAFRDRRLPHRLDDAERDRYFAEMAGLAEIMGAPVDRVPRTAAQVAQYYASIADRFAYRRGWYLAQARTAAALVKPTRAGVVDITLMSSALVALTVLPKPSRRLHRLPAATDPLLAGLYALCLPVFAALQVPTVGAAAQRWLLGSDAADVLVEARLTASPVTMTR